MPRIKEVFVPEDRISFFVHRAGAEAFGHRECDGINVEFLAMEGSDALREIHGAHRFNKFYVVALLRGDQRWMVPHLRERGLSCRVQTKGRE